MTKFKAEPGLDAAQRARIAASRRSALGRRRLRQVTEPSPLQSALRGATIVTTYDGVRESPITSASRPANFQNTTYGADTARPPGS